MKRIHSPARAARLALISLATLSALPVSIAQAAQIASGTAGTPIHNDGKYAVTVNFSVDFGAMETQCAARMSVDGATVESFVVNKSGRSFSRQLTLTGGGKKTIVLSGDTQGTSIAQGLQNTQSKPAACAGSATVEVPLPTVTPKTPGANATSTPPAPSPASTIVPPAALTGVALAPNGFDKQNSRLQFVFDGSAGRACGIDYEWTSLQNGQTAAVGSARIDSPPAAKWQLSAFEAFKELGKWRLLVKPRANGNTPNEPACQFPAGKESVIVEFAATDGNHQADPLNLYHVKVAPGTLKIGANAADVKPVNADIVVKRPSHDLSSVVCAATVEVHRNLSSEYVRQAVLIESSKGLQLAVNLNQMMAPHGGFKAGGYRVRVYSSPFNSSMTDPATQKPARGCLGEVQDDLVVQGASTIAGFSYSSVKYDGHSTIKLTPLVAGTAACRFKVRATVAHGNTDLSAKTIDYDFEHRPGQAQEEWVFRHHPPYYDNMKSRIVIESTPAQKADGSDCLGRFEREVVFKPNIPKEVVQ